MANKNNSVAVQKMEEKRSEHAKAKKTKEKVFELEKDNTSSLIVFASTNGWYKIGGRSALFYYYDIGPRIGLSPKLQNDRDFYFKFPQGIVSVNNVKNLSLKLSLIGAKPIDIDKENRIVIFQLARPYSSDEIEKFEQLDRVKREEFNEIIKITDQRPKYYSTMRQTMKRVYEFVRKGDPVNRETVGGDLVRTLEKIMKIYLQYARGDILAADFFNESIKLLQEALDLMTIINELEITTISFNIDIVRALAKSMSDLEKANKAGRLDQSKSGKNEQLKYSKVIGDAGKF